MKIKFDPVFVGVVVFYCLIERSVLPVYVVISALIHEIGHLVSMKALKYPPASFEIQPVGFKIVRQNAYGGYISDMIVAASGPLVNLLAVLVVYIFALVSRTDTAAFIIAVNLSLFAMNIIPVGILDGGRILYALLAHFFGIRAADSITPKVSVAFSIALVLVGIITFSINGYNFSLLLIGIYLLISGSRT